MPAFWRPLEECEHVAASCEKWLRFQPSNAAKQTSSGNIYINRDIVGAVVETQPFGGKNLSGSGCKAGGPNYLMQFMDERVVTVNTVAIGGNIDLINSNENN